MNDINLKLSVEEINLVLNALGNLPYIQVHNVINKIQVQGKTQLQESELPEDQHYAGNKIAKVS
ncbi:hypothetical protein [Chitinophaga sp. MM2321]|uniref:hypothetical protein n=1 Tax=Chitinophaga sp. MM2321 TaxID=3137178 RepID=UPI0032D5A9BE